MSITKLKHAGVGLLTVFALAMFVSATAPYTAEATDNKINICHATGASTYTQNSVDKNSTAEGHNGHSGDIIPSFSYWDNGPKNFPGKNWDANGQATYNNNCVVPPVDACGDISTYTKSDDFNDTRVNINFESDDEQIDVSAKTGYVITKVELDVKDDPYNGYWLYASGPVTNLNPYPGGEIKSAKITVKKTCPDLCPNVDGDQYTVPEDMFVNQAGQCLPIPASIKILKETDNATGDTVDFQFTGDLGAFGVYGDGVDFSLHGDLTAGEYDITEGTLEGWELDDVSCDGAEDYDLNGMTLTVEVEAGDTAVCTFENDIIPDMCLNIQGVQADVPEGYGQDGDNCYLDVCPNMGGLQQSVPEGYEKNQAGECIEIVIDVCPNLDGAQETIPAGMHTNNLGYCVPDVCTVEIVSDTTNTVEEKDNALAQALTFIHTGWTALIGGATWIWGDNPVVNPLVDETQTFVKTFNWSGPVTNATLEIASDNSHEYDVNGTTGGDAVEQNFASPDVYNVTSAILPGLNTLEIAVKNWGLADSNSETNPAGLLYKLKVEGTDENCANPPEEPDTEDITICKEDLDGEPVSGWGMTLSNGAVTYDLETGNDGCVTQTVLEDEGPWNATEDYREGWELDEVQVTDDGMFYEGDSGETIGCTFFGRVPVKFTDDTMVLTEMIISEDIPVQRYTCTFVNEELPVEECPIEESLMVNGSFENPIVESSNLWDKFASVLAWTTSKVSDDSATTLELHRGWSNNVAAHGEQYAELDGDQSTRVTQAVTTEAGAEYKLFWAFAPRHDMADTQNKLGVEVEGSQVATNGPAVGNAPLAVGDWTLGNYTFTAVDANTDISFADIGSPDDSLGTFLDDVRLCKIKDAPDNDEKTYTVDGYKFNDEDGDGERDEGENGLAGWTIKITDGEETLEDVTDETGYYSFEVPEGTWTVSEVQQNDWTQTGPEGGVCEYTFGDSGENNRVDLFDYIDYVQEDTSCDFYNHYTPDDGDDNDDDDDNGGGGGRRLNNDDDEDEPEGDVEGASDSKDAMQVTAVPTVAGVNAGAGGTSQTPAQTLPLIALLAMVASLAVIRKTANE